MKSKTITKAVLSATILAAGLANAATVESEITHNLAPLVNGMAVEKIVPSDRGGLYEVLTPGGIIYTDKTGSFALFNGGIIGSKTKANLTDRRMDELVKFNFAEMPLKDAIKTVRGSGKRVLVTFEDPNCGYCKKLMGKLNKVDNVTVHTFLIPILSADSSTKSKAIWCSSDPSKTWNDWMGKNVPIPAQVTSDCEAPLERNLALSRKLHIVGTPGPSTRTARRKRALSLSTSSRPS